MTLPPVFDPECERSPALSENGPRLRAALERLRHAFEYARDLGMTPWDFAVEVQALRGDGLSYNDLRWLVCKGYVSHASEVTPSAEDHRAFRAVGRLNFYKRTCFILTVGGAEFADRECRRPVDPGAHRPGLNGHAPSTNGHQAAAVARVAPVVALPRRPCWDRDRQELRVGAAVVKQFKVPAPNQETILAAFEEEGWPHRIDDPIRPHPDQDPKRRLHDTINSLNRNQRAPLVHFLGDGSGQGVRWEPTTHAAWGGGPGHHVESSLASPPSRNGGRA